MNNMLSSSETRGPIEYRGFRYLWEPRCFLTRIEAQYAIEQLWRLCAGASNWDGDAAIEIPAIHSSAVKSLHHLECQKLKWVKLNQFLPTGVSLGLDTDSLPAICQIHSANLHGFNGCGAFPLDLVAATFLLLSRWEEIHCAGPRDRHDRTQAKYTLAYRQGFLQRPIIDEWSLVLRSWLEHVSTGWRAQLPKFRLIVSHDLDHVRRFSSPWRIVRAACAELLLRSRSLLFASQTILKGIAGLMNVESDPYYQAIGRLMDNCDSFGICGSFYVMTARKASYDDGYDLNDRPYRGVLDEIRKRGHRVGWHPGYCAAAKPEIFSREKAQMDKLMGATNYGGRHHYLRWKPGESWEQWEDHGLSYDSSLGYADEIGFRCGTSHPFPCFSLARQKQLALVEEPLVIMDCALESVARRFQTHPKIIIAELIARIRAVNGSPAILYHNTYRYGSKDAAIAEDAILSAVQSSLV